MDVSADLSTLAFKHIYMNSIWLWSAIIFNVLTNIGFKYAALVENNATKKGLIFAGALVFGFLNSYCFMEALKTIPLGTASAIFFSLTIVGLFVVSYFIFNEGMNWLHIGGTFAIIAGVIMINK
ncbi:MAG: Small Multidrug Resistance protein [Bacteroidota bacterium]|nr:Small Multidrug Resistance protein [Bacteroidota bacterium]